MRLRICFRAIKRVWFRIPAAPYSLINSSRRSIIISWGYRMRLFIKRFRSKCRVFCLNNLERPLKRGCVDHQICHKKSSYQFYRTIKILYPRGRSCGAMVPRTIIISRRKQFQSAPSTAPTATAKSARVTFKRGCETLYPSKLNLATAMILLKKRIHMQKWAKLSWRSKRRIEIWMSSWKWMIDCLKKKT